MDTALVRCLAAYHSPGYGLTVPKLIPAYLAATYRKIGYAVLYDPADEAVAEADAEQIEALRLQEEQRWDRLVNHKRRR